MTPLEKFIADLNELAFFSEFTFAQNKFLPAAGSELELADNLVWFGSRAYILQLKERSEPSGDPEIERNWFKKKVLKTGTSQVRDSLRYLDENPSIAITNRHGHRFAIERSKLTAITKIVVFIGSPALPEDCWQTQFHVSQTTGEFIHVLAANDYLGILETLRVPEDIARYFDYREEVVPRLKAQGIVAAEADIMGGFLNEEDLPSPGSRSAVGRLVQDVEQFDLSNILRDLHQHIVTSDRPYDYYAILTEFARVPRSVWREVKRRLVLSLEAAAASEWTQPYRLTFPATDCTFMIAPMDPDLPATGPEGEQARITGLTNFTHIAKYLARTSKAVGILVSKDGEHVHLDWALIDSPWQADPEFEARIAAANPFRPVAEKMMDGFFLAN